jgi:hypothetical protein
MVQQELSRFDKDAFSLVSETVLSSLNTFQTVNEATWMGANKIPVLAMLSQALLSNNHSEIDPDQKRI